jgi:3'(2'), 5'-bisphosphate nucleotidase
MEWDTAAAQIILEEAGGEVVQYKSNEKVKYNKEDLLNPFFVARGTLIDA